MTEGTQRRLAAIIAADVAGYSRLMSEDEAGTLADLRELRREVLTPAVAKHRGNVVKSMGDGWLVEFASVADGVNCAIRVQEALADHARLKLRIGLHIGDVTFEDEDIYGDGVNVAARLQELAEPGAIVISGAARSAIDLKLSAGFEDMGARKLKNIREPVAVFGWGVSCIAATRPALSLPDKPSIAVLPFENMSGDPDQEYFSDGITEDIITALSKFRWFFVTARNSTFTYKGTAIDVKHVGRELGVRYVLTGSVRRAGSRLRITAQFVEAENGNHIWAERYDRELDDIFELQDEITRTIAAAVAPELAESERDRALKKPTQDLKAWDLFQRGVAKVWEFDRDSMGDGAAYLHQALALDPGFGQAYGYLAFVDYFDVILSRTDDRETTLQQGMAHARKAISIDQRDYIAHWALGRLHSAEGNHQSAIRELQISVGINPNFAQGYNGLSIAHGFAGEPKKAIECADVAIRLSPHDPQMWIFLAFKGMAYTALKDFDRAVECLEEACRYPMVQYIPWAILGAAYALTGRNSDATTALVNARRLEPRLSLQLLDAYWGSAERSFYEVINAELRKAGLPEN